jgi:hypothetical protein
MKYKVRLVLGLASMCGVFLAMAYVNPYNGKILLSELVLQLSGSRGEFALGFSMTELVSLAMRMISDYVFEIYFGTALYRHFCTASIYVFSRHPKRLRWYFGEVLSIGAMAGLYQTVLLSAVVLATALRYELQINGAGMAVLAYHFMLRGAWVYSATLIVNLLAIWVGSSFSFLAVGGIQFLCIALLGCAETIRQHLDLTALQGVLLNLNPIAHLIVGWHTSDFQAINQVLHSPYSGLDLNHSLLLMFAFCTVSLSLGAVYVKRHDLLLSDSEVGVL